MPSPVSTSQGSPGNGPLLKTIGVTLIIAQLLAFFLICSLQVRKAEARRMAVQVQETAFSDCLQYVIGSTIGSCTSGLGGQQAQPQAEVQADAGVAPAAVSSHAALGIALR
jgi:hypothetical protein